MVFFDFQSKPSLLLQFYAKKGLIKALHSAPNDFEVHITDHDLIQEQKYEKTFAARPGGWDEWLVLVA